MSNRKSPKGRGASFNPQNRFERTSLEPIDIDLEYEDHQPPVKTQFFLDSSTSILAKNDSPDVDFTYSINPYRGCEHGCIYCYARPSHEYLGFSSGLDFESKIMVKPNAPALLEESLQKKSWIPQTVVFSGNTDCYQPVEKKLELTRRCLEVFLKHRNPVGIITKSTLITRDIDLLQEMSKLRLVHVMISLTSLRPEIIQAMEPRTPMPAKRLTTIEELVKRGIPVGVNAAPIIPGLTDEELPAILKVSADHGATSAAYILVRLPYAVKQLFFDWIERKYPQRAGKILTRIQDARNGNLNDSRFGTRMSGEGEIAGAIEALFRMSAEKHQLNKRWEGLTTEHFRRVVGAQLEIF